MSVFFCAVAILTASSTVTPDNSENQGEIWLLKATLGYMLED